MWSPRKAHWFALAVLFLIVNAVGLWRFHEREGIVAAAEKAGLKLVEHRDVTSETLPSAKLAIDHLRARHDEIMAYFAPFNPRIADDWKECVQLGMVEYELHAMGKLGYELFAFERA